MSDTSRQKPLMGADCPVEDGDLIEMDVKGRKLNIVGIDGMPKTEEEIRRCLEERRASWKKPDYSNRRGVFKQFTANATSLMAGHGLNNITAGYGSPVLGSIHDSDYEISRRISASSDHC